jgi:hypothetical protein
MPVSCSHILPGKCNQCPTALEALVLEVPSSGPRVNVMALSPWEVPDWVAQVSYMGVENPYIQKTWIHDLMEVGIGMNMMLIHMAASTLNREEDSVEVVGRVAATYLQGGNQLMWDKWLIGLELTQFDTDAYALARMAEVLAVSYSVKRKSQLKVDKIGHWSRRVS